MNKRHIHTLNHVVDVYESVLSRPRFGFNVVQKTFDYGFYWTRLELNVDGEVVPITFWHTKSYVKVTSMKSGFSYCTYIPISLSVKLKKEALILAKKLSYKYIYDIVRM